jgi:hypothetical protein
MRAKEFIQSLMQAAQQAGPGVVINIGEINIDSGEGDVEEVDTALDTNKFVPPLQQKIELLKKQTATRPKNSIHNDDDIMDD